MSFATRVSGGRAVSFDVPRRGRIVLRVVALVCLLGALALALAARPASSTALAPATVRQAPTPLWSPRRAPNLFTDAAARVKLQHAIEAAAGSGEHCVAVDDTGGPLAGVNADTPLIPASTVKLLTAIAAVDTFPADFRYTTRVVNNHGALTLVGGGDPLLATDEFIASRHASFRWRDAPFTRLSQLADAVAASGVRQVTDIIVDDSRYESLRYLPEWKPSYGLEGNVGALGALAVDGGFDTAEHQVPASDPALTAGTRFAELLAARGIAVAGGVHHGVAPPNTPEIAHVDSAPLGDVLKEMLTASDDYTAELVTRELSAHAQNNQHGSTAQGTQAIVDHVRALGVDVDGLVLHDGSGLSREDRAACSTMLGAVALTKEPRFAAVAQGLPIAGRTGTLAVRFLGDPLAGALHAKTGSLDGVVGLAGSIDNASRARFAFLAGGDFSMNGGSALADGVARAVASYPDHSGLEALVPAP
jgi:D-alanyl-D-alanine carboxypeptidase/D-alanyl-D-alanine-endopeptidase (penicillin-binding protein 4)